MSFNKAFTPLENIQVQEIPAAIRKARNFWTNLTNSFESKPATFGDGQTGFTISILNNTKTELVYMNSIGFRGKIKPTKGLIHSNFSKGIYIKFSVTVYAEDWEALADFIYSQEIIDHKPFFYDALKLHYQRIVDIRDENILTARAIDTTPFSFDFYGFIPVEKMHWNTSYFVPGLGIAVMLGTEMRNISLNPLWAVQLGVDEKLSFNNSDFKDKHYKAKAIFRNVAEGVPAPYYYKESSSVVATQVSKVRKHGDGILIYEHSLYPGQPNTIVDEIFIPIEKANENGFFALPEEVDNIEAKYKQEMLNTQYKLECLKADKLKERLELEATINQKKAELEMLKHNQQIEMVDKQSTVNALQITEQLVDLEEKKQLRQYKYEDKAMDMMVKRAEYENLNLRKDVEKQALINTMVLGQQQLAFESFKNTLNIQSLVAKEALENKKNLHQNIGIAQKVICTVLGFL